MQSSPPENGGELWAMLLPLARELSDSEYSLLFALTLLPYGPSPKPHGSVLTAKDLRIIQYRRYSTLNCVADLNTLKNKGLLQVVDVELLVSFRVYVNWQKLREGVQ